MDVLECDLVGVQSLGKFNDNYKYNIYVIDVFPKFLHLVPLKSKIGLAVAAALRSIFDDRRRRPVWARTDKSKELLNNTFKRC